MTVRVRCLICKEVITVLRKPKMYFVHCHTAQQYATAEILSNSDFIPRRPWMREKLLKKPSKPTPEPQEEDFQTMGAD